MNRLAGIITEKYLNSGTALVLMGVQWLYLWAIPWHKYFVENPHHGTNYAQAIAFLTVGLAYYNRRLLSDILAFLAVLLIIPAALELLPHPVTAITGGSLLILVIIDILVERKRKQDLAIPSSKPLAFWLKKHMPRFSYIILAHLAFLYFLVRLPAGTYETDLVTKVFDGMLIPFVVLILLEDMPGIFKSVIAKRVGFFWGMAAMIVSLVLLSGQPETWPTMVITCLVTVIGIVAFIVSLRKPAQVDGGG